MYYIIFPRGDESRLSVVDIEDYEVGDYLLASRMSDYNLEPVYKYARALATANNLILENKSLSKEERQEVAYLD